MRSHMRLIHKKEFAEHNQWEMVEVSQDMLDINATDPKVKVAEDQAEIEESNMASLVRISGEKSPISKFCSSNFSA